MNIQLHRKQMVILGLAMVLAVASYWIPTPQKPLSSMATPAVHKSVGHLEPIATTFDREVATSRRLSVAESVAQTAIPSRSTTTKDDDSSRQLLNHSQSLSVGDFTKNKMSEAGYPLLISVMNTSL
jgi:hypothetical protein